MFILLVASLECEIMQGDQSRCDVYENVSLLNILKYTKHFQSYVLLHADSLVLSYLCCCMPKRCVLHNEISQKVCDNYIQCCQLSEVYLICSAFLQLAVFLSLCY